MRRLSILHVSDLHIPDEPGQQLRLDDVWPSGVLGDRRFDFIVVSGDLSDQAGTCRNRDEYKELLSFAQNRLLGSLQRPEPRRVIFVPGNHDVNWQWPVTEQVALSRATPETLEEIAYLQRNPAGERPGDGGRHMRLSISRWGHAEFFRLEPIAYPRRFENVQGFLNSFYGESLADTPNRSFDLLSPIEHGADWSAHIFREEGIAFFGLNSCSRNDRLWHGAAFNQRAITQALDHAMKHAPGLQWIAVWHHGVMSEPYRQDYLPLGELARIHEGGFRIGMHGHTHLYEQQDLSWALPTNFALLSVGSLSAGARQRPGAVGNQFAVVNLTPGVPRIRVELFEKTGGRAQQYQRTKEREFAIAPVHPEDARLNRASSVERECVVFADGLARVRVVMENVFLRSKLTLALLTTPFCEVQHAKEAQADTRRIRVRDEELADRRWHFYLEAPSQAEGERIKRLEWEYWVSNAVALTKADVRRQDDSDRRRHYAGLSEDQTVRPHTVRLDCETLKISIRSDSAVFVMTQPSAVAERAVQQNGEITWEKYELTTGRSSLSCSEDGRSAELRVACPEPFDRYGIVFVPREDGTQVETDGETASFLAAIVASCLDSEVSGLQSALTKGIEERLCAEDALGAEGLNGCRWCAFLWDQEARRIAPTFGRFPPRYWRPRFSAGNGVAGHAFRFDQITSWVNDPGQRTRPQTTIYQHKPEGQDWRADHYWLLCMPLRAGFGGPPLGAVSFEGVQSNVHAPNSPLAEFARRMQQTGTGPAPADVQRIHLLITLQFWDVILAVDDNTEGSFLSPRRRQLVESFLLSLRS